MVMMTLIVASIRARALTGETGEPFATYRRREPWAGARAYSCARLAERERWENDGWMLWETYWPGGVVERSVAAHEDSRAAQDAQVAWAGD